MMLFSEKIEQLLARLEKERLIYWNIDRETAVWVYQYIKEKGYLKILEIGTSTGYSAIWWALAVGEGGVVWTVESHGGRFLLAKNNFEESGLGSRIRQLAGHAPEIVLTNRESIYAVDMMFFDATKLEYVRYLNDLAGLLKPGGSIVADNILSHPEGVSTFVQDICRKKEFRVRILEIGTGLLIAEKLH